MIKQELEGNLLSLFASDRSTRPFNAIAHGCNCFHTMGGGIARPISQAYPEVLEADRRTRYGVANKLGQYSAAATRDGMVFNMYTQFTPGLNGRLWAVAEAFKKVNKDIATMGMDITLGIPLIGCGIAGLSWEEVKEQINLNTPDVNIIVVHFKP